MSAWKPCFTVDGFFHDYPNAELIQRESDRDYVKRRIERANPDRTGAVFLASILRDLAWLDIINDWERQFLDSTEHYKKLSEKQEAVIWRIHAKLLQWTMRA